ncbi:hypothetical protein BU15DRAFT_63608 [Melanogaster broomeanus]|nr:hypothetical protein BU15DRAFT_63608 [Melanogaster broomeanus]
MAAAASSYLPTQAHSKHPYFLRRLNPASTCPACGGRMLEAQPSWKNFECMPNPSVVGTRSWADLGSDVVEVPLPVWYSLAMSGRDVQVRTDWLWWTFLAPREAKAWEEPAMPMMSRLRAWLRYRRYGTTGWAHEMWFILGQRCRAECEAIAGGIYASCRNLESASLDLVPTQTFSPCPEHNRVQHYTSKDGGWGSEERVALDSTFFQPDPTVMVYDHGDRYQILIDYRTVYYYDKRINANVRSVSYPHAASIADIHLLEPCATLPLIQQDYNRVEANFTAETKRGRVSLKYQESGTGASVYGAK